jgi:nicotinamide mononucleotide transporter
VTDWGHIWDGVVAGLLATRTSEAVSSLLGLAYSVLAIWRSRWCWIAGGISSALLVYLALDARLPMQSALNVYYVVVSVYGWWHWTREEDTHGNIVVGVWPVGLHLAACIGIAAISWLTARWLVAETQAAWPFLDSLTTWGSLFATWLAARVKLENWLYWLVIDSLLVLLFAAQGLYFIALLSVLYVGFSVVGFVRWLRTYRTLLPVS